MKPSVYLETTIPSYLTARPSRNPIRLAHQQLTRAWWDGPRSGFDLYTSQYVITECRGGDPEAADERLAALADIPLLDQTDRGDDLADALVAALRLPPRVAVDALHIAVCAVNGVNYLLTWNCTHLANAALRGRIEGVCRGHGFEPPVICTPQELAGGRGDTDADDAGG